MAYAFYFLCRLPLLGCVPNDQLTRSLESIRTLEPTQLLLDLFPGGCSLGIVYTRQHLVERPEGFPLEAHTLGGRW
jgi:hypothetical protein